jgi:hypothetical protein
MPETIIIRRAHSSDAEALDRLAQLGCSHVPEGDLLIALVDAIKARAGENRATGRVRRRRVRTALRLA